MIQPALTIDDDVFGDLVPGDPLAGQSEGYVVQTSDQQTAIAAMLRAGARIFLTRSDGVEYGSTSEMYEYMSTPVQPYHLPTPSWVSDVYEVPDGLAIVFDACSTIPPPMAVALRRILLQEFSRAAVTSARITRLGDHELGAVVARMPDE